MLDGAPEVHNTPGGLIKLMWHADWAQLSTSLLAHFVEQAVGDAVQTEVASLLFAVLAHAVVETDAADSLQRCEEEDEDWRGKDHADEHEEQAFLAHRVVPPRPS